MQSYVLVLSILLSSVLLVSASLMVSSAKEDTSADRQLNSVVPSLLRFLVTPKTITSTVTVSNTNLFVKSVTTSCATSDGPLTPCRKRRSVMEMHSTHDSINPSAPVEVMATAYPEMRSLDSKTDAVSSTDVQPSMENTSGMAEVQIRDMESICKARVANPFFGVGLAQVFGITVLYSTTVTATQQVTITSTSVVLTNKFTIVGCLPSPLPFSVCT